MFSISELEAGVPVLMRGFSIAAYSDHGRVSVGKLPDHFILKELCTLLLLQKAHYYLQLLLHCVLFFFFIRPLTVNLKNSFLKENIELSLI